MILEKIYDNDQNVNHLKILSKKALSAVFTMDSAFCYHNLTDVVPEKECLVLRKDRTKIKDNRISVIYYERSVLMN